MAVRRGARRLVGRIRDAAGVRRFLRRIVVACLACAWLPVGAAQAVPTSAIPPDLTRLAAAWAKLVPKQLVMAVTVVNTVKGKTERARSVVVIHGSPDQEQVTTTIDGQTLVVRSFGQTLYVSGPGIAAADGGRHWLRASQAEVSSTVNAAAGLQTAMSKRLLSVLGAAASVQEVGPATVDGQATTAFAIVGPAAPSLSTRLWFAPNGQLVHAVLAAGAEVITADLSTTTPVHVHHPPARTTIDLSQVPSPQRSKAKGDVQVVTYTAGLFASLVITQI